MKRVSGVKNHPKPLLIKAPYKPPRKTILPTLIQSAPSVPPLISDNFPSYSPFGSTSRGSSRRFFSFPSLPGAPISPIDAFQKYSALLTPEETQDLANYSQIYWIRKDDPDEVPTSSLNPQDRNFFPFEKDGNIIFRFQQLAVIGRGAYGIAIRCYDHKTKKQYILKIIRDNEIIHPQVQMELNSLRTLLTRDPTPSRVVHLFEDFTARGFQFFVFEILGCDIYSTLKAEGYVGFEKCQLQMIFRQVAEALAFTHASGIIHCDLKPENVLWTDSRKINVKLIDYGCSCFVGRPMFKYIQSRYYRAPEIILGLPYGPPIDVWSLGCLMAELATGEVLFPGHNEAEQIHLFVEILGLPPAQMLAKATKRKSFFADNGLPLMLVANHAELRPPMGLMARLKMNDRVFVSLLQQCLKWNPEERIRAKDILRHPWLKQSMPKL